jgi:hypothetical protein
MKRISFIALLLLISISAWAQLVGISSSIPPNIEWRQLNTDTVRVIYPKGLDAQARRIGGMIHHMAKMNTGSIGPKVRKIDLFLLDKTVVSNGYVATPPYHSKFFTQAPQLSFAGTTDWLDLLAIHEYRHVQQMNNALNGITKCLYYAFGELLWTGAAHLAAPPWFWEGDAIIQETLLSHSGRGTVPSFGVYLKTIADQEDLFSYEKMVCGSYRDLIPNHYYLGYELSLYGRTQFGNDFWREIYKESVAFKRIFWPFSSALNARTDLRSADLYEKTMEELSSDRLDESITPEIQMLGKKGLPTTYSHPKFLGDSSLIVLKSDFKTESWLMKVDLNGEEEKLLPVGYGMGTYDVAGTTVIWNEIKAHRRWADVSYSNLFLYDLSTSKIRQLTDRTRYFAPALSSDGKRILVTETEEGMKNYLVILDAESGVVLQRIPSPGNAFVTFPVWMDDKNIAWVAQKNNQQSVLSLNTKRYILDTLVAAQYRLIEYLQVQNGFLYYLSNTSNQKNQLVRLDLESRQVRKSHPNVVPYLLEMPELSPSGKIAFISAGFNQKKLVISSEAALLSFQDSSLGLGDLDRLYSKGKRDYALHRMTLEEGGKLPDSFEFQATEKKYTPGIGKLKFHSWIVNPSIPNLSLMLQANDALGTSGLYIEPGYNFNEGAFFTKVNFSYGAFYPRIDLSLNTLLGRSIRIVSEEPQSYNWNEWVLGGQLSLPLSSTHRNFAYRFSPALGYRFIQTSGFKEMGDPTYHAAYASLSYAWVRRSAYRSIYTRLGMTGNMSVQKVVNNTDLPVVDARLKFYFPGLFKTHSLFVDTEFRYQEEDNTYYFPNNLYYTSSGFGSSLPSDWRSVSRVYYAFPLGYPDLAIGPFAFVKRLRMDLNYGVNLFQTADGSTYDYAHRAGFTLISDARYFRIFDLSFGMGFGVFFKEGEIKSFDFNLIFGER